MAVGSRSGSITSVSILSISHRMLFRVDNGVLDVLDLITRETLMTTLKRIRGAR